ncbi:ornithine cyclodeaminase family protein [Mycobacterium sp. NPDC003449]
MLFITESEILRVLDDPVPLLDALGQAYAALSSGRATVPDRTRTDVGDDSYFLSMPGYLPGIGIAGKLVSVFPLNDTAIAPTHSGVVCLFDESTGVPLAVLDGGALTKVRTAGASALSVSVLARENSRVLCILGAGEQGRAHLELISQIRPFSEIRVWDRDVERSHRLVADTSIAAEMVVAESAEAAAYGADVVSMCTRATEPFLRAEHITPGTHVTSIGGAPPLGELDRELITPGDLFVETLKAFQPPPVGCVELDGLRVNAGSEIGNVLAGDAAGRVNDIQITVWKASGHAVSDVAAGFLCYRRATMQN